MHDEPELFSESISRKFINDFGFVKYLSLIELFLLELEEKAESIEKAINDEDMDGVRKLAHSLIASSKAVGMIQLSKKFQDIQEVAGLGNASQACNEIREMLFLKDESLNELHNFLATQK